MRNFKDSYKGQDKIKVRKNRRVDLDDFQFTFFNHYRTEPEFMSEDYGFNVDAELEADFEGVSA